METKLPTSQSRDATTRVWLEGSILYVKFVGEFSIEGILDVERQCLEVIQRNGIKLIPFIVDVGDVDDGDMHLHITEIGKIFSSIDVVKHFSMVLLVGAKGNLRKIVSVVNSTFLGGRLQYAETVNEAQSIVRNSKDSPGSILEPAI